MFSDRWQLDTFYTSKLTHLLNYAFVFIADWIYIVTEL